MSGSPVARTEDAVTSRRVALVVAVTDYVDGAVRRLRAPAGDAAELRDLLADPEIGGFSVTSVVNERAQQIRLSIEDFLSDRRPNDLLLVYLSCHGLMDARRRLYFAARDTIKNRLASSGVEAHWLLDQLEECRARRQIVILDCCFSGAFAHGAKGDDDDIRLGERLVGEGRGRVVLTASRASEYSFEGEPLQGEDSARGSVFTSALIDGIRSGRADLDEDGDISVDDAYAYAFEQVRRSGTQQTPQRWLYGAEGSILLAHTAQRQAASDVPDPAPELVAATEPAPVPRRGDSSRPRARTALIAGVAALALGAAVLVGVLIAPDGDPGATSTNGGGGGDTVTDTFTTEAPWRFKIDNDTEATRDGEIGCDVTLTPADNTDQRVWRNFFGASTYQMADGGDFTYQVNDPGCLVVHLDGDDLTSLPFSSNAQDGDTRAFQSPGFVSISVSAWNGSSTCKLVLNTVAEGKTINTADAVDGKGPVRMSTNGPARVYVASPTCDIQVAAAE
ncbi:MAG: hypothetical protein HOQ45_07435 [Nocardioidaceae bacterium]|nr:hypothetical protein [Nocardioidaceae bacterium]